MMSLCAVKPLAMTRPAFLGVLGKSQYRQSGDRLFKKELETIDVFGGFLPVTR
jgi:hypothetical protein